MLLYKHFLHTMWDITGFNIKVNLLLKTKEISKVLEEYKKYWFDSFDSLKIN